MKKSILLILMPVLLFFVTSCGEKEEVTPSNVQNNNGGQGSFEETTRHFVQGPIGLKNSALYIMTDTTGWGSQWTDDQSTHPDYKGAPSNYQRQKTDACNEPSTNPGTIVKITSPGRYFYKIETGNFPNPYTITHKGYIDVASDGSSVLTEISTNPSKYRTFLEECIETRITYVYY